MSNEVKSRTVLRVEKTESGRIYIHDGEESSVAEAWQDKDGYSHVVLAPGPVQYRRMLSRIAEFYL